MKPIPAIVEPAPIDLDLIEAQIAVALKGQADAERTAERHEQAATSAREAARMRRMEIGQLLTRARPAWPKSGPTSKGWGVFLARHGIDDATARRYMDEYRDPAGFAHRERNDPASKPRPADGHYPDADGPRIAPAPRGDQPPFRQLTEDDLIQALGRLDPEAKKRVLKSGRANVAGGSGEVERGTWCTSREWAEAVGAWDLDPFSNPRSKIASITRCMLEGGGDGFGAGDGAPPGRYRVGERLGIPAALGFADATTRVWLQPPYEDGFVERVIAHYGHTRFCALLRWSPDVAWFQALWPLVAVVCHPVGARMAFDPPPGVETSGAMPFPHALYYRDERDVTDAVRARCIVWRIDHSLDRALPPPAALHVVR